MKNYKDTITNEVYAYESNGSQDLFIKEGLVPITDAEAATIHSDTYQIIRDAMTYSELRRTKYNQLNQDEMRFDDLVNSTTTWHDAIVAIKLEYPK